MGALLGASPGASTAAPIMVELLKRCFPTRMSDWEPKLKEMLPGYGVKLNENASLATEVQSMTDRVLKLV